MKTLEQIEAILQSKGWLLAGHHQLGTGFMVHYIKDNRTIHLNTYNDDPHVYITII